MERNAGQIVISMVAVIALFIVVIFATNALAVVTVTPSVFWTVDTNRGQNMTTILGKIAFDDSYPTGGEPLTLADFGFFDVRMDLFLIYCGCQGYTFQYDLVNSAVQVYYSDDNDTLDGPLIEVPNTGDLSIIDDACFEAIGW